MEELELADPVVKPEVVTAKFRVIAVTLDMESTTPGPGSPGPGEPGLIFIKLRDNNNAQHNYSYHGAEAISFMKFMNTANFSVNSMHKRILQKLSNDGVLPGTVVGAPEP